MDFQEILVKFEGVLNKYSEDLSSLGVDISIVTTASKKCYNDNGVWNYPTRPFQISLPFTHIPSKTIPNILRECEQNLEITLITKEVKIKILNQNDIINPIESLKFDIIIKCDQYVASWHLDQHEKDENDGVSTYLHPQSHFTFGGYVMEEANTEYGNAIIMRNPRLMHPPMDLILGIDFIFNQFLPREKLPILEDKVYIALMRQVKQILWKPYLLALANNFCDNWNIETQDLKFDTKFCESLIGKH